MMTLNSENKPFDMNELRNNITKKNTITVSGDPIYYSVLDFSRQRSPDYFVRKLSSSRVDIYEDSGVLMQVGPFRLMVPYKWNMIVSYMDEMQYMSMEDIMGRPYEAFALNPWKGYMPSRLPITILNMTKKESFIHPKLGRNDLLCVPVGFEKKVDNQVRDYPTCIFLGERSCKVPDSIDLSIMW